MPIIKSAKKRVRTAEKAAIRNSKTKRVLKTALKTFRKDASDGAATADSHAAAQSNIDKAAKKGLIHKNKAARQKAQLARTAKAAGSAAPTKKTTAATKKATTTKAVPKKPSSTVKKPAATKKVVAKTTAKKPAAKK